MHCGPTYVKTLWKVKQRIIMAANNIMQAIEILCIQIKCITEHTILPRGIGNFAVFNNGLAILKWLTNSVHTLSTQVAAVV